MQVNLFYLVCIFLFYVKLSLAGFETAMGLSTSSTMAFSNGKLTRTPQNNYAFISATNNHSTNNHSINYPKNSKTNSYSVKAGLNKQPTSAPLPIEKKNNFDPYQLANVFYDNPGKVGTPSFKIYDSTARVLKSLFKFWLDSKDDLEKIANDFGVDNDIVVTVNGAMAQLFDMQHESQMESIEKLGELFYYMTDIKHMTENDRKSSTIQKKLEQLIRNIEYSIENQPKNNHDNDELTQVVENLKNTLDFYHNDKYNLSYTLVNAKLMKGLVLINKTSNENLNKLIESLSEEFLNEIKAKQYELSPSSIAENHANCLCHILPDVFGLLHNHVELVTILSKHKINDDDQETVRYTSRFLNDIINTFIERISNFGNKKQRGFEKIKKLLTKLEAIKTDPENFAKLDTTELLNFAEGAVAELLNLVGKKDIEKWKQSTIFKLNYLPDKDASYYMELIAINSETTYSLLEAFEAEFVSEYRAKENVVD